MYEKVDIAEPEAISVLQMMDLDRDGAVSVDDFMVRVRSRYTEVGVIELVLDPTSANEQHLFRSAKLSLCSCRLRQANEFHRKARETLYATNSH